MSTDTLAARTLPCGSFSLEINMNWIGTTSVVVLVALNTAYAGVQQAPRATNRPPIDALKQSYLRCAQAANHIRLGATDLMRCSLVAEELKARGFGGDFERLVAWWRAQPAAPAPQQCTRDD